MLSKRGFLLSGASVLGAAALSAGLLRTGQTKAAAPGPFPVTKTSAQWRAELTPAQFKVLREHGTERPFTSPLNEEQRRGVFHCAGCDLPVFSSSTKFESGTGWPSFSDHLPGAVGTSEDKTLLATRTEVHCARCGGHLGHVFDDGPKPTGLRYCMNGVAMTFKPAEAA